MAVYDLKQTTSHGANSYTASTLTEQHVYGASRIGLIDQTTVVVDGNGTASVPTYKFGHEVGEHRYEITNHLGNVNAVITDNKTWNTGGYYEAEIVSKIDYYPFGMEMPGRKTITDDYRFAYNGMELDNEVRGNGGSYTTEFRQYDPRLGRWMSLDPLRVKYPMMSLYVAFNNNPVLYIDIPGSEAWPVYNAWSKEYIEGYRAFVKVRSAEMIKQKQTFTCEDFALALLIEYAKENNLPLTIENGSGIYNQELYHDDIYSPSGEKIYDAYSAFYEDVLKTTGANDINQYNAKYLGNWYSLYKAKPGQLLLLDQHHSGRKTHTQVVMSNDKKNDKIQIRQGNLNYRIWAKLGGDSPSSSVYGGLRIQNGTYDLKNNSFQNHYTNAAPSKNVSKSFGLGVFEWDFQKFNNQSISPKGKGDVNNEYIDSPIPKQGNNMEPEINNT